MKRYIGFYLESYYPGGGHADIVIISDNIEEVELALYDKCKYDTYGGTLEIWDTVDGAYKKLSLDTIEGMMVDTDEHSFYDKKFTLDVIINELNKLGWNTLER